MLLMSYMYLIIPAYKSKYNKERENQVILLMIIAVKKWHYLAAKKLSALLRGITSNHKEDFYCLICFHSYTINHKLEKHYNVYKNHDYCYVEKPKEDDKKLKIESRRKILESSIYYLFNS